MFSQLLSSRRVTDSCPNAPSAWDPRKSLPPCSVLSENESDWSVQVVGSRQNPRCPDSVPSAWPNALFLSSMLQLDTGVIFAARSSQGWESVSGYYSRCCKASIRVAVRSSAGLCTKRSPVTYHSASRSSRSVIVVCASSAGVPAAPANPSWLAWK